MINNIKHSLRQSHIHVQNWPRHLYKLQAAVLLYHISILVASAQSLAASRTPASLNSTNPKPCATGHNFMWDCRSYCGEQMRTVALLLECQSHRIAKLLQIVLRESDLSCLRFPGSLIHHHCGILRMNYGISWHISGMSIFAQACPV